ncbi:MAG: hypothetical protein ACD_79C00473G0007 [uncultured bacterium]|nr:MAG: hypothetical protein ACD_79C00473G0007 [uncultured bacterium]
MPIIETLVSGISPQIFFTICNLLGEVEQTTMSLVCEDLVSSLSFLTNSDISRIALFLSFSTSKDKSLSPFL